MSFRCSGLQCFSSFSTQIGLSRHEDDCPEVLDRTANAARKAKKDEKKRFEAREKARDSYKKAKKRRPLTLARNIEANGRVQSSTVSCFGIVIRWMTMV